MENSPQKKTKTECNVGEVISAESCATIHGVVTALSPVKCSKKNSKTKYFTGTLSDGAKKLRMVSFDTRLRPQLCESLKDRTSVVLNGCSVKEGQAGSLEIVSNGKTKIERSSREFSIPENLDPRESRDVMVEEIENISLTEAVNVVVKVVAVEKPHNVRAANSWRELTKQDCVVGDVTETVRVVLWEEDVGKLDEDRSYKLTNVIVRMYRGERYLSISDGSVIEEVADIGEIAEPESGGASTSRANVVYGCISAVLGCDDYLCCVNCRSKVDERSSDLGTVWCSKCSATMRWTRCTSSNMARVIIESEDPTRDIQPVRATIFDNVLSTLLKSAPAGITITEQLLSVPSCAFTIHNNIVMGAQIKADFEATT